MDLNIEPQNYRGLGPPLGPDADDRRLDQFLAAHFPFRSRQEWKYTCAHGHLLVNGTPSRATRRLRRGDVLAVFHPLENEPEVDESIHLIKREGGVLAVFKPGNLPMHESGFFRRKTFTALVHSHFGTEWAPVHRLDRETSGVVICAATPELRRQLSWEFERRSVRKRYLAVLEGIVAWQREIVDQPLAAAGGEGPSKVVISADGMASVTEFRAKEHGKDATLVEALPRTGRFNQIRAHAAWLGHPVVGDKTYHSVPAGFARHALHAEEIEITHPETGALFSAYAALPDDLRALWEQKRT